MNKVAFLLAVVLILGFGPAVSFGADQSEYNPWGGVFGSAKIADRPFDFQASKIIGTPVENRAGDMLGKITDLMIDSRDGRIAFAVISRGGVLGIPTRFTAIPFSALTPDREKKLYLLDVSREKMAAAPTFGRDQWPDIRNRTWEAENFRYFGQTPYWEE